ncbi:hypothetical protein WR164_13860 [Philodulcilactobacillus myokoensis]|uniref:Uncharacterized protein n=1 Tax=Philodulcilactobacillus myokoensis TaxID=2929573 RepID=A0A9W6ETI1_9LACO|nr:MarR family transcriptional regulator [Philodulcilactobacillus myokoensis]GLB47407.1 hypothetical protein WR164_13860 [Philodulcilactobacillus myokoensis]
MRSYLKQYLEFEESGLKPSEVSVLVHLYDRMNLSIRNDSFYDKKYNASYVIYPRTELARRMNINPSTITRTIKKLVKKGWIIIKKQFNAPNKFFLPHFILPESYTAQNTTSKSAKCNSNQTDYNHTNKCTSETEVTKNVEKNSEQSNFNEKFKEDAVNTLGRALHEQTGLSKRVVDTIIRYSFNSKKTLYKYASLIFKAKKAGYYQAMRYNAHNRNNYGAFRFEVNPYLSDKLEFKLKDIIINARDKARNFYGYVFSSLVDWFTSRADQYMQEDATKCKDNGAIPIFRIGKNS